MAPKGSRSTKQSNIHDLNEERDILELENCYMSSSVKVGDEAFIVDDTNPTFSKRYLYTIINGKHTWVYQEHIMTEDTPSNNKDLPQVPQDAISTTPVNVSTAKSATAKGGRRKKQTSSTAESTNVAPPDTERDLKQQLQDILAMIKENNTNDAYIALTKFMQENEEVLHAQKKPRKRTAYNEFVSNTMSALSTTHKHLTSKERMAEAVRLWKEKSASS